MSDPTTRNTGVRPDFWRDPAEQQQEDPIAAADEDHASPFSVGGEEASGATQGAVSGTDEIAVASAQDSAHSDHTAEPNAATADQTESQFADVPILTSESNGEQATIPHDPAQSELRTLIQQSSDPSVPTAEVAASQDTTQNAPSSEFGTYDPSQVNAASDSNVQVDIQALLDTLQPPFASTVAATSANTASQADGTPIQTQSYQVPASPSQQYAPGAESSPLSASALGIPPSGLPPRPPPQELPLIHPNYVHSQHIRDYHPHASHPAFQPHARSGSNGGEQSMSTGFVPPVASLATQQQQPTVGDQSATSYVGTSYTSNGSYTSQQPPTAAPGTTPQAQPTYPPTGFAGSPQVQQSPSAGPPGTAWATSPTNMYTPTEAYGNTTGTPMAAPGEQRRPEERPWDAEVQRKYDNFIEEERRYVSEGRWEMFPQGSRLFVGNLSSEKVTKRDIFHVFHLYGDLAQISIKQAYGFVQFLRTEDCMRALETEQGTLIRDKRIRMSPKEAEYGEKANKSTDLEVSKPQKNRNQNNQRRSRSPPNRAGSGVDRYTSGSRGGNSRNDRRDGYRPGYRSPSPRGYRDRYDDRYRARSRSPNGYSRNDRYRSPSPRRDTDDDLPLPRRSRDQVPDVQIVSLDPLDRDFIAWVEKAFSSRSVKVDVLLLSPRFSEQSVIRRQIVEGVIAVVKLTRQTQNTGKIGLQIFDRKNAGPSGADNVRFEEYDQLDPPIAAELVLRAKSHQAPQGWGAQPSYQPPQQQYSQQPTYSAYNTTPAYGQSQPPAGYQQSYGQQQPPPNLQNLITNLDPNNLQNLMTNMGTPQSGKQSAGGYAAVPPNSAVPQTAAAAYGAYPPQQPQQSAQPSSAGGQVNMQEILARLGSYQQR